MATRLPQPGADNGQWGQILNDFLAVEHNTDGTLKKAADIAAKYEKPNTGIPAGDLSTGVQGSLAKAETSVQSVNAKFPSSGAVILTAGDVGADAAGSANAAEAAANLVMTRRAPLPKGVYGSLQWDFYNGDISVIKKNIAALSDMGIEIMRCNLQWGIDGYAGPGTFYGFFDPVVDAAEELGIKLVVSLETSPDWARSHGYEQQPDNNADLAAFAGLAAARYKGRIYAWQIWNEPNVTKFWHGTISGASYVDMVSVVSPAIRNADPGALIIAAGLGAEPFAVSASQSTNYLAAMIAAGIDEYVDAYDFHPYSVNGTAPDVVSGAGGTVTLRDFRCYELIHQVLVDNNITKPLWMTEFGWTTAPTTLNVNGAWMTGVSEADQATYTARALELLNEQPYITQAFVFIMRDFGSTTPTPTSEPTNYLGIYRYDWTPKPVAEIIKRRPRSGVVNPSPSIAGHDTEWILEETSDGVQNTIPRILATSSFTLTSGTLFLTHFTHRRTQYLDKFRIMAGPTPSSGSAPTLLQIGLFEVNADGSLTQVSVTPHTATMLNAAYKVSEIDTSFTFIKRGQRYAVGILCVTSGTAPTVAGQVLTQGATLWAAPTLATKVAGQASMPTTVTAGAQTQTGERALIGLM